MMMTAATDSIRDESTGAFGRLVSSRVLVFRSCRMPQFAVTLAWIRSRWPLAAIDVVSSPGFDDALRAAGVSRTFHYRGRSFGTLRNAALVRRLRAEGFEHIVIPQANDVAGQHANLYRAAGAIGAARFVVAAADASPTVLEPRAFRWLTFHASFFRILDAVDVPLLLVLLLLAHLTPRRKVAAARGPRRVLHVISSFGVGGAQVQLAELIGRTPTETYHVDVLVLGRQDGDFARQWLTRDDVTFHYSSEWPRRSMAVLEVARLCRAERYDLVHTWLFMANVIGAAGARLGGASRIVGSVRNMSLWKRTWYAQWWFRAADALATRVADQVTVNATPLVADHAAWTWLGEHRLMVVPNGLDPEAVTRHGADAPAWLRGELALPPETPVVGTVGRLAPEKDQAMFIRAVALARAAGADLHAVIVGDGVLRQTLERQAREDGVADRVHFLGERHDSRRVIAGLDVFVLTSHIEGFPNVLLEAAFLGVPAVSTSVGGASDVLDPDDLVEPNDAAGTCRLILARLARREVALEHATAFRQRALARFTVVRSTARWLALYDRLLSDQGDGQ